MLPCWLTACALLGFLGGPRAAFLGNRGELGTWGKQWHLITTSDVGFVTQSVAPEEVVVRETHIVPGFVLDDAGYNYRPGYREQGYG